MTQVSPNKQGALFQPSIDSAHSGHTSISPSISVSTNESFASILQKAESGSPPHSYGFNNGKPINASTSLSHSKHIPIGVPGHAGGAGVQQKLLGLRAYRQQLIASNIANADTPNYKAVDVDFEEAARTFRSSATVPPLVLAHSSTGHVSGQHTSNVPPFPLKYHIPAQPSIDGNTVEMDVERVKLSQNMVMYQFSLDRVSGHFKHLMELFRDLK